MAEFAPVYVQQFGAFWKLTDAQWIDLLKSGAAGNGHILPEDQQLKSRPKFVRKERFEGADFYCTDGHRFFNPLDWDERDYADQLAEEMEDRADPQA